MRASRKDNRRLRVRILSGIMFLLFLGAQGVGQQGTVPGEPLYRSYCAICHGERGDGRGPAAPSMGGRVVDFTNPEYWKSSSDGMVTQAILKGKGRMPAQSVSPEEARAIVDYMKSAFKGRYGS